MTTKTATGGLFKPELWSTKLNVEIDKSGVMLDCVNRDYEGEIKDKGDTVHILTVGEMTVSDYVKNGNLSYSEPDGDDQVLVIDQKKAFGFTVNDIDKVQANINYIKKYTDKAKTKLVNTQDAFLLGKSADVLAANQMGEINLTKDNAYDTLVDLMMLLADSNGVDRNMKGGDGKCPWLVVDPKTYGIFLKAPEAIHATKLGDEVVRKGTLLRLAGFDVKCSTNMTPVNVSDTIKTTILAGTTEAITFASQIAKMVSNRDKDNPFVDYIAGLYLYGAKTVNPQCLASFVNVKAT